ncbi:MAG: amidohydrolase family protein [Pseudomonadota bacterium]
MAKEIVLRNARLIDGVSDQPRDRVSIVMKDGRITSVTDGDGPAGPGAEIVDCTGKTVMSGLIDTHVHSTFIDRTDLTLFLAAGVTAARDVGGRLDKVLRLRAQVNSGEVAGPRLYVYGPLLDGSENSFAVGPLSDMVDNIPNAAAAPGKINHFLDSGVDGIKVYFTMPPETVKAVIRTVDKRVPITGHLGYTTAMQAIELGIDGLEHIWISPYQDICSLEMRLAPGASMSNRSFWTHTLKGWEEMNLQAPNAQAFFGAMVEKQVKMGTTLDLLWTAYAGLEGALADPDRAYIPPHCLARQAAQNKKVKAGAAWDIHPGYWEPGEGRKALDKQLDAVRILHEKGGVVVGGTDCGGLNYPPPGFALLREVELLSQAMGAMAALKAVTVGAARALRREHELGKVKPGYFADLILLDKDPSKDVRDLRSLSKVYRGGIAYDPKVLLAARPVRDLTAIPA